ncbi:zincin-like metallopeptidase domain-containing protein [Sulfurospirillum sp. hDNRA2]|uniref:zincin-like metallopeptidase domain-containing protein n=1 Tax=Sulfurospirillum sp. hDNRA2 TaxID=3237298 RepID=UPI0020B79C48|nr:zincin-like metallopeptidase domain-containing protein [Sulfurospirillum sp. DNRA8]MCP3653251.1 zincin-like metallopeptidase domain-containing protein [Sulfurospirillum sp. DNRA8]MCR1812103.1 zincin-like metallopeptidase domain-containing protein [Sulfurospirillum sp. DNRA8]
MDNLQKSYTDKVAEKIIEALENGTAPWVRPWKGAELNSIRPYNPTTNKPYKGINFVNLSIEQMNKGYNDPRWLTYKQAQAIGANVRQGEKGTPIQYWQFTEEITVLDENNKPILDQDGKPQKMTVELDNPKVFYSTVFNANQIDGLPKIEISTENKKTFEVIEEAEKILKNSNAKISHQAGNRAYYMPSTDSITLPQKEQFISEMAYYSTALHELGHWTGHSSRLDRDLTGSFGSKSYAKEELRAEIGSYMLCSNLSLDFDPGNHNAYIKSWVQNLQDQPNEIFKAASDAGKITQYLQDFSLDRSKEITQDNVLTQNDLEKNNEFDVKNLSERVSEAKFNNLHIPLETVENLIDRYGIIRADDSSIKNVWAELSIDGNKYMLSTNKSYGVITPREKWDKDAFDSLKSPYMTITELKKISSTQRDKPQNLFKEKTYLTVSYADRDQAKSNGAKWDHASKRWYAPKGTDIEKLSQFLSKSKDQDMER